ncbi:MAG: DUF2721 domain-containing protein [Beijerinckiaceae bacterium]
MLEEVTRLSRISDAITHSTSPAFFLAAVATYLAVLFVRIENLMGRMRLLRREDERERVGAYPDLDILRLKRRVALLHRAIFCALVAAISGTVIVIISFSLALSGAVHQYGVAILFVLALASLCAALALFATEVVLAMRDFDRAD